MTPALLVGLSVMAHGQPVQLLDFEDQSVGSPVFSQYHGVTFRGGDASPPQTQIVEPVAGALSGTQAVRATRRGEGSGSGLELEFAEGQARVKLSVGLEDNGTVHQGLLAVLRGYDTRTPTIEERANPVAESAIVYLGAPPRTVDTPLEILSAGDDIVTAELVILSQNWETSSPPSPDQVAVVIDNLEFAPPAEPPIPDVLAPAITVESPFEGQTVRGVAPGGLETNVRGFVDEQGLRFLTVQVNGGTPFALSHGGGVAGRYRFLITLFGTDGLVDGANEVVIEAEDFAGNASRTVRRFNYLVKPVPPPTDVDLVPIAVEVNQAISHGPMGLFTAEADGFSITVPDWTPLIQDRDTLVRIYAVAEGATSSVSPVPARMVVMRDDCTTDCRLGELSPLRSATTTSRGITVRAAGTAGATPDAMAKRLNDTWNFLIPAAWTRRPLQLLVDINTPTWSGSDRVAECKADFLGECERGNRVTIEVAFREPHVATVNPILVRFQGQFNGAPVDDRPTAADVATLVEGLNTLYPTRFDVGPTRMITVDPSISGGSLLRELQDRFGCRPAYVTSPGTWLACGFDPTTFNVALVPGRYNLGWRGLATVGNNTVWSIVSRTTPAHEAGHAIGFIHATCDHGEADGGDCDSYYPGEHGRLLGIGFDQLNWRLRVDGTNMHMHDVMSYGTPRWVSRVMWNVTADHPYVDDVGYDWCTDGAFGVPYRCGLSQSDGPSTRSARPGPQGPVLIVRGWIDEHGEARFDDAYRAEVAGIARALMPNAPTYQLEALDVDGNTLTTLQVQPQETLGADVPMARILVELALPDGQGRPFDRVQLRDPEGDILGVLQARTDGALDVAITSMGGSTPWQRDEIRRLTWTATPQTTAQVELQLVGEPGVVLGSQVTDAFLDVPVSELPSSSQASIVVRVSDGVRNAVAVSEQFEIPVGPPTAQIIAPRGPLTLSRGMPVSLFGVGASDRGPLDAGRLTWWADSVGDLGRGSHVAVVDLPLGVHTITLRADGPGGLEASDVVVVTVVDDAGEGCGCSGGPRPAWLGLAWIAMLFLRRRRSVTTG